jgi:hypothetical protein
MNNIKLFERFFTEEDSNINERDFTEEKELVKAIVKTWVNDYVIPMIGYETWPPGESFIEKDPKFRAFVSKAKAWLRKNSGIPKESIFTDEIVGTYTNSDIVRLNLYKPMELAAPNKGKYPIIASFYEDLD